MMIIIIINVKFNWNERWVYFCWSLVL